MWRTMARLLALTVARVSLGQIVYVDDDAPLGGDGATWATAFRYLQDGLGAAPTDGEVRVAGGVYLPDHCESCGPLEGNRDVSFQLVGERKTVRGGYRGLAPGGDPNEHNPAVFVTALSGDLNGDDGPGFVNRGDNSRNVVAVNEGAREIVFSSLLIRGGESDGGASLPWGGGVQIVGGQVTLEGCVVQDNRASDGGGVYALPVLGDVRLIRCVIRENEASTGGGVCIHPPQGEVEAISLIDCVVEENNAEDGGGIAVAASGNIPGPAVLMDGCAVRRNTARRRGGGVWIDTRSALEGCVIAENRVTTSSGLGLNGGGGAYVTRATELRDCVVRDNISSENGGGAWIARGSPVLERCRILRNQARAGGGLQFRPVAQPQIGGTVRSCLIADNFARAGGGVWHDSAPAEGAWFIDTIFVDNIMSEDGPDGPVNVPATAGGAFRLFYGEPRLVGCVFVGNAAHGRDECTEGGALGFADLTSSDGQIAWLANCTFAGNRVELLEGAPAGQVLRGGAMNVLGAGFLANCRFVGNSAGDGLGGALSNAGTCALANSLFARNDATAIVNDASASPLRLANAVLWANVRAGNLMDQAAQLQGPAQIDYSCVQGWDGSLGGEGNIGADPLFAPPIAGLWTGAATYDPNAVQTTFVDAAAAFSSNTLAGRFINPDNEQTLQSVIVSNTATTITVWGDFAALGAAGVGYAINDYRLTSESPLIDAASNFAVPADALDLDGDGDSNEPTPVDLHGCPRFLDDPGRPDSGAGSAPLVDMGPLEYNACPADLDGDGVVGILDLATILSNYGRIGNVAPCDGDLDGSGEIDLIDLGGLLSAFGSSCP